MAPRPRRRGVTLVVLGLLLATLAHVSAQAPSIVNGQTRLTDAGVSSDAIRANSFVYGSGTLSETLTTGGYLVRSDGAALIPPGTTNLHTKIVQILDAGHRHVLLAPGEYTASGDINVYGWRDSVTIEGAGMNLTRINCTSTSGACLHVGQGNTGQNDNNQSWYVTLKGFTLKGPGSSGNTANGIILNWAYRSVVRDVYVSHFGDHGIAWNTGFYNQIQQAHVEYVGGDCMRLQATTNAMTVIDSHVRACGGTGLLVGQATDGVQVFGGSFQAAQYGIQIQQSDNIHVYGSYLEGNSVYDVYANPGNGNEVESLGLYGINSNGDFDNPTTAIYLDRVTKGMIVGGRTNNGVTVASTSTNVHFDNFDVKGAKSFLGGVTWRFGTDYEEYAGGAKVVDVSLGGVSWREDYVGRYFSLFTDFDGSSVSERLRITNGGATTDFRVLNSILKVNNMAADSGGTITVSSAFALGGNKITGLGTPTATTDAATKAYVDASGPTGSRPGSPATGQSYFDTDLGKPIWHNGSGWVDATGAAV